MSFAMPVAAAPIPDASPFFANGQASDGAARDQAAPANKPAAGQSASGDRRVRSNGRLKEEVVADADRHCAIATHLSPLAFVWIGPFALAIPLVLWLVRKDKSVFADDHGRETTNFLMSFLVLHVLLAITIIGIALIPVLWVVAIVNMIRGAIAASQNEYFRYPVTIRFF